MTVYERIVAPGEYSIGNYVHIKELFSEQEFELGVIWLLLILIGVCFLKHFLEVWRLQSLAQLHGSHRELVLAELPVDRCRIRTLDEWLKLINHEDHGVDNRNDVIPTTHCLPPELVSRCKNIVALEV